MIPLVILCHCPDQLSAKQIADQLVKKRLAACVNIISGVASVYRWENQVEHTDEVLLMIKTMDKNYSAIEAFILSVHPYQVPDIIALPMNKVEQNYLNWLKV